MLRELSARRGRPGQVIVGFAAETERRSLGQRPGQAGRARAATCSSSTRSAAALAFGTDDNEAVILAADGAVTRSRAAARRSSPTRSGTWWRRVCP